MWRINSDRLQQQRGRALENSAGAAANKICLSEENQHATVVVAPRYISFNITSASFRERCTARERACLDSVYTATILHRERGNSTNHRRSDRPCSTVLIVLIV